MRPIFTHTEGNVMTYGWWDRFLRWSIHKLENYIERRHERLWDEALYADWEKGVW